MKTQKTGFRAALLIAALVSSASSSRAAEPTLSDLDQKVKVLERRLEIADEAAAAKSKEASVVTAGKDGFALSSADKVFQLKLRGYSQVDARFFIDDSADTGVDNVVIRRARMIFDGALGKHFAFRVAPDFGGGTTQLQDGYIDFKGSPLANVRFGRSKVPFGLERLQSSADTLMNEAALSTALTPNYDEGIQLYGSASGGVLDYALGIFNGGPDGASVDSDSTDDKDLAGRLWLTPFKNSDASALRGLSFGLAGTFGKQEGTDAAAGLPSFRSGGQQTFFSYKSSTNKSEVAYADGDRTRLSPQLYYAAGAFGLLGEYVISEQDVANATTSQSLKNEGWQVAAQFVLTGETPSLKGLKPLRSFDPAEGNWGAFELVAQLSSLDVDDAAFAGKLADSKKAATQADSIGGGLNWYLTRNAKFVTTYTQTSFDGGAASGDRPDEKVIIARAQIAF